MDLYRFPPIKVVRKEDDPAFLKKHGFEPAKGLEELLPGTPPSFTLRDRMTPARNQGSAGTCTSFACMAALEFFYKPSAPNGDIDLSEGEATHWAEKTHGDCTAGLAISHCMLTLRDRGAALEQFWGYDPMQICWANPPNVDAQQHYRFRAAELAFYRPKAAILDYMRRQIGGEASINGLFLPTRTKPPIPGNFVPIIKNIVANGKMPVVVGVPVWWASDGHFSAGWESGPDVQMPTPVLLENFLKAQDAPGTPPNVSGWHAIAICGYDDSRARLFFKNSWNWWWGDNGFGTIPYDYITQYADVGYYGSV